MGNSVKSLVILGSTGSIGTQTLDIVRAFPEKLRIVGLAAKKNFSKLEKQMREFSPRMFYCETLGESYRITGTQTYKKCSLVEMVSDAEVDMVVSATVGDVAIPATFAAIKEGKDIALANKETVVIAGKQLMRAAKRSKVRILPLDSEPNAIWQCLRGEPHEISKLFITASGGPFRKTPKSTLRNVTPEEAVKHPTWHMGTKISIDSATMMNKAFEVIEARWLFDVPWENINVVLHPQSIIHSMVEFADGSVKAQISPPDMHLPIQYALLHPDRKFNPEITRFNPLKTGSLTFEEVDGERFPCFDMALKIAKREGTWPAALCGANDMAVNLFIENKIGFLEIPTLISETLSQHVSIENPTIDEALLAAASSSKRAEEIVKGRGDK